MEIATKFSLVIVYSWKIMLKTVLGVSGILILSILLFVLFSQINFPGIRNPTGQKKLMTEKDVPELREILSSDQETRLKGGRKLVERVGVEKALEILENSALPHTGEGHLVVHQIGFYAYQKYGPKSILKCKDYFLYACYHGAIIEAASGQGFEAISKMTDQCKKSAGRYFQCVHAAGHSILAIWDYNLPEALKTCDQLYQKETQFPEALTSCHNGAFMENLFGVHDWGTRETPKRDWLRSDDPYFPCNAFEEKYQKGCWLNQAARIYQMLKGDIARTTDACYRVGNAQYSEWCLDNLSRQIHALTNGSSKKVFELCSFLGLNWREKCIIVNAGSFYSVGDSQTAVTICQWILPQAQSQCFQQLIAQIASDSINKKEKLAVCKKIGGFFEAQCQKAVKS